MRYYLDAAPIIYLVEQRQPFATAEDASLPLRPPWRTDADHRLRHRGGFHSAYLLPLGEPLQAPLTASCMRSTPLEEDADQRGVADVVMIEPLPAYEFDQRVIW